MVVRGLVAIVAATVLLGTGAFARAAAFGLSPMRVELSSAAPTAVVQVTNSGEAPVTIQVQQRAWRQVDGKDLNEDTRALVVNPPIFTVKPLGRQLVRIALRTPPAGRVEQAYRMVFAEVPASRAEHGPGFAFQIAVRLDIPVFVAPITGKATPKATWSIVGDDVTKRLRIGNEGNGNLRLTQLKVTQGERALAEAGVLVVLPGAFRLVELSGKLADDPLHVRAVQGLGSGEAVDFTLPPAVH